VVDEQIRPVLLVVLAEVDVAVQYETNTMLQSRNGLFGFGQVRESRRAVVQIGVDVVRAGRARSRQVPTRPAALVVHNQLLTEPRFTKNSYGWPWTHCGMSCFFWYVTGPSGEIAVNCVVSTLGDTIVCWTISAARP